MPQLDLYCFSTQFFWFSFFFSVIYLTIVKHIIPNINRVYKLREQSIDFAIETKSSQNQNLFYKAFSNLKKSILVEKQLLNIEKRFVNSLASLYLLHIKSYAKFNLKNNIKDHTYSFPLFIQNSRSSSLQTIMSI
uniref:ATP synthase F0 subunit 8 n=1 Tax=Symbiochloris sp. SG-2018 TaxID=2126034 RepID=A0A976YD92_9CHLO|nr:ATP synthase F0 subunit 8 [Symbiochloris sp. SG-2018]UVF37869.1 ATP synthase F0 subunit 8 [Symbiochloris sp. SG-2018]